MEQVVKRTKTNVLPRPRPRLVGLIRSARRGGADHPSQAEGGWSIPPTVTRGSFDHTRLVHILPPARQPAPPSSTESKLGESSLGWLQGSFERIAFDAVLSEFASWFGPPAHRGGIWRYSARYSWESGAFIAYDPTDIDNPSDHFSICIPGSVLLSQDGSALIDLLRTLHRLGFRPTRLDAAFDDYSWIIDPLRVLLTALSGDVSGFRTLGIAGRTCNDGHMGITAAFGTRGKDGGGKYLRVYDKFAESGGVTDCVRWEVEFADEHAKSAFAQLLQADSPEYLATVLSSFVGGCVDFPKRSGRKGHLDRLPRHSWWLSLKEQMGHAKTLAYRQETTMERRKEWVSNSVSRVLYLLQVYLESGGLSVHDFLDDVLKRGASKASEEQVERAILEAQGGVVVPFDLKPFPRPKLTRRGDKYTRAIA